MPILFPPSETSDPNGIVAVGGKLTVPRVLAAYRRGIFPWPHEGEPMLWFCPDPRAVIDVASFRPSRSLCKWVRRHRWRGHLDGQFAAVMRACAEVPRSGQGGTWITEDMRRVYGDIFERGLAHSVEVYDGDALVGGLYGLSLGRMFFGESMFSRAPNGSKAALAFLVAHLRQWQMHTVDCQMDTTHLRTLGAHTVPRGEFLRMVERSNRFPDRRGPWSNALDLAGACDALRRHTASGEDP